MSRARRDAFVVGMMSGTSADGIDVALVRIKAHGAISPRSAQIEQFATIPYPAAMRELILRVAEGARVTAGEISHLNFGIAEEFARAALTALRRWRLRPQRTDRLARPNNIS